MKIEGFQGTRFADVYYYTPSPERLLSTAEVRRYLREHPNEADGVDLAQFSFKILMPVKENSLKEHHKHRRMPWNEGRKK